MASNALPYPEDTGGQETMYLDGQPADAHTMPGMPVIKVVGIGGGGCNAITRMFKEKLALVDYYGVNTDAQHLYRCDVGHQIAIGQNLTKGLGAGANPDLGRQAAEESREELERALAGANMVFLAVGMGGGHRHRCGTGNRPAGQGGRSPHRGRSQQAICLRSGHTPEECRGRYSPSQGPRGHPHSDSQRLSPPASTGTKSRP